MQLNGEHQSLWLYIEHVSDQMTTARAEMSARMDRMDHRQWQTLGAIMAFGSAIIVALIGVVAALLVQGGS